MRFLVLTIFVLCSWAPFSMARSEPSAADLVRDGQEIDLSSPQYTDFFRELETKYHFNREELLSVFRGVSIKRKVLQLMDQQWEGKPYYKYRLLFVTPSSVAKGKKELLKHRQLFDRIEKEFGVDREVIVAIWGIESRFGTNTGSFNLFRALNTLFAAYPRRSDFFRKELIHFLLLCRENNLDPLSIKGSYAGAFGQAQFMPSSYNEYGVDFDGDSRRDLISSPEDIFASIANYLKRFNWVLHAPLFADIGNELKDDILVAAYRKGRKGRVDWRLVARVQDRKIPRPQKNGRLSIIGLEKSPFLGGGTRFVAGYPNLQAITEYNHSNKYAMAVAEMALAFGEKN